MPDLGIRLQLLIGPTVPLPAPFEVVDALVELTVNNNDRERDGFQMTFTLGKQPLSDYTLLKLGLLDPPARVIIIAIVNALPQVLIDGMITDHQVQPSNTPGQSTLTVTGEDISLKLDLEEKRTTHPNLPDSLIVTKIIGSYGLVPVVTTTTDVPIEVNRIPTQQGTDLAYVRELARRNGFVFYVEPTDVPGVTSAYWGPAKRQGLPQSALSMNMGPDTNVDTPINFRFNALGPTDPQVRIVETASRQQIPIPLPGGLQLPLSSSPATPLRKTLPRGTANLSSSQASLRAVAESSDATDAVTGTGQLDAVRYGRALRSRRLVDVRGAGFSYDGTYYVRQVTHTIRRGQYQQSFTLARDGRGPISPMVVP
jgi:hypothetical protein